LQDILSTHTEIVASKGAAKLAIAQDAVSINKTNRTDEDLVLTDQDFLHDKYLLVENGKKNKFLIEIV